MKLKSDDCFMMLCTGASSLDNVVRGHLLPASYLRSSVLYVFGRSMFLSFGIYRLCTRHGDAACRRLSSPGALDLLVKIRAKMRGRVKLFDSKGIVLTACRGDGDGHRKNLDDSVTMMSPLVRLHDHYSAIHLLDSHLRDQRHSIYQACFSLHGQASSPSAADQDP